MCELCGQVQPDTRQLDGHTVCSSARWCLIRAVREAPDLLVRQMQRMALESTLTGCDDVLRLDGVA